MTMSFLQRLRRRGSGVMLAAALLAGCGGGGEDYWDEFRPRAASVEDVERGSFLFTDFSYGAVFDPALERTPTTLGFGVAQAQGSAHVLPFSLAASGARSTGTATLDGARLRLLVEANAAGHPFAAGQVIDLDIEADVDDGRIRLSNRASGVEQTSAPAD